MREGAYGRLPRLENYQLRRLIAEGGTARVYWGIDRRNGNAVAVKELKARFLNNPALRQNFMNMETQLMVYAQHPNMPKLVEFVDVRETDQLFLVMEFVEGYDLQHYIYRKIGLIPEKKALPMFMEVLDTVAFLHQIEIPHLNIYNGVLHLDIKPNNVMLQPNGHVKLIDLGIASRLDGGSSTGFGTPYYMPPEQWNKGRCGKYTDVWALGVMLFEMLTGHVPFASNHPDIRANRNELREQINYAPTPPMRQYYQFITDELQQIVEGALRKSPLERYQTCDDFGEQIKAYMRKHNINR